MKPIGDRFVVQIRTGFIMTSWNRVIGCALLSLAVLSCQRSREAKSAEESKQELLALENRWLQVEDDPVALEDILAPDFLHVVPRGNHHERTTPSVSARTSCERPACGQAFRRSARKSLRRGGHCEWCRDQND
jgi:hypothetical protein